MNTAARRSTAIARAAHRRQQGSRRLGVRLARMSARNAHNVEGESRRMWIIAALDYGQLLSAFADWAMATTLRAILAHNSAKLYDFA